MESDFGHIVTLHLPNLSQTTYSSRSQFEYSLHLAMDTFLQSLPEPPSSSTPREFLVVLPELIGAWFMLSSNDTPLSPSFHPPLNHHHLPSSTSTTTSAMLPLILKKPFTFFTQFVRTAFSTRGNTKISWLGVLQRALFLSYSQKTLNLYYDIFSSFAKKYQCFVIAGSAYLPRLKPTVENSPLNFNPIVSSTMKPQISTKRHICCSKNSHREIKIVNGDTSLFNTTFSFGKDGTLLNITYKTKPIAEEQSFVDAADICNIKPFHCGRFGLVGVLICADSWFADCYQPLMSAFQPQVDDHHDDVNLPSKEKNDDDDDHLIEYDRLIIAVPTFSDDEDGKVRWEGYSGYDNPDDIIVDDIHNISLADAWLKYALPLKLSLFDFIRNDIISEDKLCGWRGRRRGREVIGVNSSLFGQIFEMKGNSTSLICHAKYPPPHGDHRREGEGEREGEGGDHNAEIIHPCIRSSGKVDVFYRIPLLPL